MVDEKETGTPDYEEEEYENNLLKWMSAGVVVLTVAGFVALAWYAYRSGTESIAPEEVPLIAAAEGDIKETPADPGGMQFPNQDKMIYEAMSGSAPKPAAERILPPPEEPVEMATPEADEPAVAETWVNEKLYDKKAASPAATPEIKKETAAAPQPKPAPAPAPKPEPVAAPKVSSSGSVRVQLASLTSREEAEASWKKLSAKHGDLLEGKGHDIVRADLEKGTYYRLQVTGLKDRDQAAALCEAFKDRGQGCFIAK